MFSHSLGFGAILLAVVSVSFLPITPNSAAPQEKSPSAQQPQERQQDPDVISRRDFMRTKLMFSQQVFEGLTTGDFLLIDEAVEEIETITGGDRWVTIDNPEYQKLTDDFKTATKRLKLAAKSRNIEATALRYYQLSTSCIDCHQHIRSARYEF